VGGILGAISFPIFAGASTFAVGKVFIQHFESGGTFLDFKPAEVKEYFLEQFDAGKLLVAQMKADTKPSASVPNPVRAGASTTA
jgi:hypothetical protein